MPAPRFSVIIPVQNRPHLVRQAIESVLAQDDPTTEIIVVDDASSDDTPRALRAFGDKIRPVFLEQPQGCEVARNAGAALARGDYLAFLDSDDLLLPGALGTYAFIIDVTRRPALMVSRLAGFTETSPPPAPDPRDGTVDFVVFADYLARDRTIASSASMIVVRRDVFAEVGGFRSSTAATFNGSDHDFLLRVGCHGPAVLIEKPAVVGYRLHGGNSVRDIRRVVEGIMRIIRAEREGIYPGGARRRLDRRSVIGNQTYWWCRCALLQRRPLLAARLFFSGADMILARIVKRLRTQRLAKLPITHAVRSESGRSPSAESAKATP